MSPRPTLRARRTRLRAGLSTLPVLVAVAACLLVVPAGPAAAHASLVSSSPRDGARLDGMPARLELTFSEDMQSPAFVVVTAPDGSSVADGDPRVRGSEVVQELADGPAGAYTAAFRVVSEDGHPVTGELSFRVGEHDAEASEPAPTEPSTGASTEPSTDAEPSSASATRAEASEGFWTRHGTHVLVGAVLFGLAALLLALSRRAPR